MTTLNSTLPHFLGKGEQRSAAESGVRGYALVAALIVLVGASLAVTLAVESAQLEAQREREAQLLFVGDQYRRAIANYFVHPPLGQATVYPKSLQDLVLDSRGLTVRRWLRKLYPDPMTGRLDWQLDRSGERIAGVHSSSSVTPIRGAGFDSIDASFAQAHSYQDWRFEANGAAISMAASAQAPASLNPGRNCQLQYAVPQNQCSQQPPPMGSDTASCVASYQQLLDQCVASIPGN